MRISKLLVVGALIFCCLVIGSFLQISLVALFVIVPVACLGWLVFRQDPDTAESESLRQSIAASSQDIRDILDAYDRFCYSPDADSLTERTLHYPALADKKCRIKEIRIFHQQAERSRRFLRRLENQLSTKCTLSHLERLLALTDHRCQELSQAWHKAKQVAKTYGVNY
ncbi:hypothetical protein GP475_06935 [Corynebacterium poyangense]|uniref:Uncharacterized protein n=1 Tax=Corynebacterium poyangense TaxID=2684405 RepID=A0A7H0SPC2_9CORY|nr:hypothetical protein [Corynebacterium poyangense]QNQ90397.1 hypothetical protein GP475_06935 [Corynebacterium poyangense]